VGGFLTPEEPDDPTLDTLLLLNAELLTYGAKPEVFA